MATKSNCGSRTINRDSVDRREMFPKFLASLDCLVCRNRKGSSQYLTCPALSLTRSSPRNWPRSDESESPRQSNRECHCHKENRPRDAAATGGSESVQHRMNRHLHLLSVPVSMPSSGVRVFAWFDQGATNPSESRTSRTLAATLPCENGFWRKAKDSSRPWSRISASSV